ncbi:MAG: Ribosomal protein S6 modification enzyme (Glutaminyl transferase) related protein [Candidatus Moranbacteria bacterium GW2011_GWA2_39_41]|nr:MAG: Ribosomal protein S6 modification enzyme (Glutaminyl transferase) related protein [Candidatus Moranbacteria bacterium GW2011_GWA2_39_41]
MKKLKFIIIGYPNKNTLDLVAEIKSRKYPVSIVPLKEIVFEFSKNKFKASWNNVNLNKYDVFIFRAYNIHVDEARILAEKLISAGKIVLDEALGKQFFQNKLFDASKTTRFGLNHPQTFMALDPSSYEKIASKIKFPVVIKPCAGQKGKGIKKIETKKDFLTFFKKNPKGYLIQEFFALKSDIRGFCCRKQGFRSIPKVYTQR